MEKLLKLINGKKTTIATVIMLIVLFCVNRGYIATDVSELIGSIMLALGIGVNITNFTKKNSVV